MSVFRDAGHLPSRGGWDPDRLPADWAATRDQWLRWHYLRTGLSAGAFLCVLAWMVRR